MKSTKFTNNIQSSLDTLMQEYNQLQAIIRKIDESGGISYLVGGAVRDMMLGIAVKDIDIEVHGIELDDLAAILNVFGSVNLVGKSFGVLRVGSLDVDWSLPRIDSSGRRPEVSIDAHMGIEKALCRRDLTINAMALNLVTHELIDPLGGRLDIESRTLRCVDPDIFIEDPLRFYRVMQFVGRFEMTPDTVLDHVCSFMTISNISRERISEEFEKLLLKSRRPSLGIRWIHKIGRLGEVLPELYALVGVAQDHRWHPEGDVFEHTMQALDAAAQLQYNDNNQKIIVMFAALCHDLGKVSTTVIGDDRISSHGHAEVGVVPTQALLGRITLKKDLISSVCKLVKYHMHVVHFIADEAKASAYKRLAKKLNPDVTLEMLALLAKADSLARSPEPGFPLKEVDTGIEKFLDKARALAVHVAPEPPILMGRDLLDVVVPGPYLGAMVKLAYEIQINEGIKDKQVLKDRVLSKIHT